MRIICDVIVEHVNDEIMKRDTVNDPALRVFLD